GYPPLPVSCIADGWPNLLLHRCTILRSDKIAHQMANALIAVAAHPAERAVRVSDDAIRCDQADTINCTLDQRQKNVQLGLHAAQSLVGRHMDRELLFEIRDPLL